MDMLSKKYFLLELPFFLLEIDTSQLAKNEKIVPTYTLLVFPHRPKSVFFEKKKFPILSAKVSGAVVPFNTKKSQLVSLSK